MRLGLYPAELAEGSIVARGLRRAPTSRSGTGTATRSTTPTATQLEAGRAGLLRAPRRTAGWSSSSSCPATCTRTSSATQAHPELRSRPTRPHPLFAGLVEAALDRQRSCGSRSTSRCAAGRAPRPTMSGSRRRRTARDRTDPCLAGHESTVSPDGCGIAVRDDRSAPGTARRRSARRGRAPGRGRRSSRSTTQRPGAAASASTATRSRHRLWELPAGLLDVDGRGPAGRGAARAGRGGRPGARERWTHLLDDVLPRRGCSDEAIADLPGPRACTPAADRGGFVAEARGGRAWTRRHGCRVDDLARRRCSRGRGRPTGRLRARPVLAATRWSPAESSAADLAARPPVTAGRSSARRTAGPRRPTTRRRLRRRRDVRRREGRHPREVKNHEYRVAITPAGVHELVAHGHEVFVEAGAGRRLVDHRRGVRRGRREDPADRRRRLGRPPTWCSRSRSRSPRSTTGCATGQMLFTYLHLAAVQARCTDALLERKVTGIAYETVELPDGVAAAAGADVRGRRPAGAAGRRAPPDAGRRAAAAC